MGLLYELQAQLETLENEKKTGKEEKAGHLEVIKTNLPAVTAYCEMEDYHGDWSYESLRNYMKEAEKILSKRSNLITLKADKKVQEFIRNNGKEALMQLKRDNHNLKLEDCVIGADQLHMYEVIDNYVVPRTGQIFLTPNSRIGRAPFYSSEKILGSWHIPTLWFNLSVLMLMSVIAALLLLTDCPGRYVRKENH